MFASGFMTWAKISQVIEVCAVGHSRNASRFGERFQFIKQCALAEVTPHVVVALIFGLVDFIGDNFHDPIRTAVLAYEQPRALPQPDSAKQR